MTDANKMSSLTGKHVNVAMMTAGGLAPCLSSSIAQLVHYWVEARKTGKIAGLELRFYNAGYKGLLTGDSFVLPESEWGTCDALNYLGGSPIGNSRVKVSLFLHERILDGKNTRLYLISLPLMSCRLFLTNAYVSAKLISS